MSRIRLGARTGPPGRLRRRDESWRSSAAAVTRLRIESSLIMPFPLSVNCAFTTVYGQAQLSNFEVWSYQVDPSEVSIGDPIDLSKRLCGTPQIRFPYAR